MTAKLDYFGQARAAKVHVGNKSVSVHLDRDEAAVLAEKILRASNERTSVSFVVYPNKLTHGRAQITVVSRAPKIQH
jgi:hypothetical protein